MTGGVNNIRRKVETAVAAYLVANDNPGAGVNVYRWLDAVDGDRYASPSIHVACLSSRPVSADLDATSGCTNRVATVTVKVRTWAADERDGGVVVATGRDAHDTLAGRVMDSLHVSTLVAELNANAPAGIQFTQVDLPTDEDSVEERAIITTITFDVLAHGTAGT